MARFLKLIKVIFTSGRNRMGNTLKKGDCIIFPRLLYTDEKNENSREKVKNVDKTVENNGISYMLFFCLPCRMERFRIDCGLHQPPDGTPANVCDRLQALDKKDGGYKKGVNFRDFSKRGQKSNITGRMAVRLVRYSSMASRESLLFLMVCVPTPITTRLGPGPVFQRSRT